MNIESLDPSQLNRAPVPAPTAPAPAAPVLGEPAPLEAPTPQVRNPLLGDAAATNPAPTPAKP